MTKLQLRTVLLATPLLLLSVQPLLAAKPSGMPTRMPLRDELTPRPIREVTTVVRPSGVPSGTPGQNDKLQACLAREANIKTRSENMTRFSTKLVETFDKIAIRVQEFNTTKGLSVANYSVLTADVAAKKVAATTALTKAQASMVGFDCTTGDPKTRLRAFNTNMNAVQTALKNYKTSVRNLIVAVHSQAPSGTPTDKQSGTQNGKPTRKPTNVRPTTGGFQIED